MSERKVLNKYYPPDFDPSKIPRMKLPKNRQYTVRLMAPFNMRCATCGEYIYKGKKFNARKEDVENEDYLGIRIYRFYIKCTRCLQEISFKTDPKNTDYEIEAGATRNFMALKLAEEQALREEEEQKEEEASNPMKLLENRTKQSKNEIELLESLEELKDLNRRQQAVDYDTMLSAYDTKMSEREREEKMQQMDEEFIKTIKFQNTNKRKVVVEEQIVEDEPPVKAIKPETDKSNKLETTEKDAKSETTVSEPPKKVTPGELRNKTVRPLSKWKPMSGLVKVNKAAKNKPRDPTDVSTAKPTTEGSTQIATSNFILTDAKKLDIKSNVELKSESTAESKSNGLLMLGAYSGSENSDSN